MADEEDLELTREGLLGELAGKTKQAVGELFGNQHLAQVGRDQQAEIEADAEAASVAEDS